MELIKITENNGQKAVSAKELYLFLSVDDGRHFKEWVKRNIIDLFTERVDYQTLPLSSTGGRPSLDYAITIDTAKEISMMSRCENGKKARQYFIECEKKAITISKPKTQIELLLESVQLIAEIERKQLSLESRIDEI